MRHRIVRVVARVRDLVSRLARVRSTDHVPPYVSDSGGDTSPLPPRLPRLLDELIDGDASRLVRPYLVSCERQARERARQLFAYDGQFSVYAVQAA